MASGDSVELLVGQLIAGDLVTNELLGVGKSKVVAVRLAGFDERNEAAHDGFDLGEQFAVAGEIALEASSFVDGHHAPLYKSSHPDKQSHTDDLCQPASVIWDCERVWTAGFPSLSWAVSIPAGFRKLTEDSG